MIIEKEPRFNYVWCEECHNSFAKIIVHLGDIDNKNHLRFHVCKECAWTLAEALDKTTATDFERVEM